MSAYLQGNFVPKEFVWTAGHLTFGTYEIYNAVAWTYKCSRWLDQPLNGAKHNHLVEKTCETDSIFPAFHSVMQWVHLAACLMFSLLSHVVCLTRVRRLRSWHNFLRPQQLSQHSVKCSRF